MKTMLIVLALWVTPSLLIVTAALWFTRSPGRKACGEARRLSGPSTVVPHTSDGGHQPRGGGAPDAVRSLPRGPGLHLRPSVPAHERLLNYRPARENRGWCNDMALAGALDEWSREGSR